MITERRAINVILLLLLLLVAAVLVSESHGQTTDLNGLREYLTKNEEMLREAESIVRGTNSTKARTSLDAARQLQRTAVEYYENARPLLSAQLAQRAREAILKTIQLAKRDTKLEERAQKLIEQAARRNEQARTWYDESSDRENVPAKKLIDESINQLLRARTNMNQHMFEVAIQAANASIDLSNRAIALLKRDSIGPELVRREIARTDRLLDRIDDRADRITSTDLAPLLQEAHRLQDSARRNEKQGRYIFAFEETRRARTIARRIINRFGAATATNEDAVAGALGLTDKLIDRAAEIARENGDERALTRLDEASRLQQNARDSYTSGRYESALALTQRAREIARNAMRTMSQDIDAESVRGTLERTDQALSKLRSALEGADNEEAEDLFRRASDRQASAWDAFESGEMKRALANSKVARNLAGTALRLLENGPN
jgi:hypothetical protein